MTSIVKAEADDYQVLADIGKQSFIESHGSSASAEDINNYVSKTYREDIIRAELNDPKNNYHIMYHDEQPAGYSKIIYNAPHHNVESPNVTKLDRIYLQEKFHGLRSGYELLNFNIELSVKNNQSGMWLFVWKENHRAVRFYEKTGFKIIGSYDFKISDTHSNPNHQMFLKY
jgi:ribosomal protein S18 acetylase RimI-like enzyme